MLHSYEVLGVSKNYFDYERLKNIRLILVYLYYELTKKVCTMSVDVVRPTFICEWYKYMFFEWCLLRNELL